MKKVIFSLALLLTSSLLGFAQKGISYQAIILDPKPIEIPGQDITGQPFVNGQVSLKFKLFSSTFIQEFEEVHTTQTDAYGMVNVLIGSQNAAAFSALVWDINPRNMQVWVSFDQGGNYTKVSEQVLTYTPYALYAETTGTAGKLSGTLTISEGGTGAKTAENARTNLGLGNVDNTSDANKPVSIATQSALDAKANALTTYVNNQVAAATIPDADASNKGKIQLAGDLAGTAAAPTVPGLALKADAAQVNAALNLKANAADVTNSLALKANAAEMRTLLNEKEILDNKSINVLTDAASDSKYPTVKSIKTYVDAQVAGATIADADASTKGKIQLAGDLAGTAAAPTVPGLALKADAAAVTSALNLKANTADVMTAFSTKETTDNKSISVVADGGSDNKYPTVKSVKTYVDAQVAGATIADANASTKGKIQLAGDLAGTAAAPTVPGLALKADAAAVTSALNLKANAADVTSALATKVNSSSLSTVATSGDYNDLSNKPTISSTYALPTASASTLGGIKVGANLSIDGGGALSADLSAGNISGTVAVGKGGTGANSLTGYVKGTGTTAMTASASIPVADVTGAAPLASPTFTGTLTAPIYASTPQALTDNTTLSWDPANGLNASVTLGGNRTLSFSPTPVAGAYGTLVVTQDGTGNRTLTLPSASNKILGSSSTTTIGLSTAANSIDIVNFYFDGTNYFWNVGQGFGTAATAEATNLASSVSGTLPVANGGTGATTLASNNVLLGNGTSALQVVAPGNSGNVLTSNGTSWSSTAPAVAKPISDQFTATAAQTSFTLTQTPIANTTVSPNVKPNVWMFINGIRINNTAYSISGTTVTYTASSNNSYTLVVGDRIQFDYAY